jgi:hypothetical protein
MLPVAMADDFDFQPVDLGSLIVTEADIEAMILKPGDYERLARVPLRPKQRGRSKSWAKVKAYRARQRAGLAVLRVTIPQYEVTEFLIASGRLSEAEALDRRRVENAVAEVVVELAARWRPSA